MNNQPSQKEIDQAAKTILASKGSKFLPLTIFYAVAETMVTSPVDLIILIQHEGLKVLVTKRPNDDPYVPSFWHISGKVMINEDNNFEDTIRRILETELSNIALDVGPNSLGSFFEKFERGSEHGEVFWATASYGVVKNMLSEDIVLADPENLPTPFIDRQRRFIERAKSEYLDSL